MKFFDTNVLFGMAKKESRFRPYDRQPFRTSDANIFELSCLLRWKGLAPDMTPLLGASEPVTRADFMSAAELRIRNRLPATDALCYAVARRLGMVFVTADRKHFRGLPGVELV